jgi:hypothetical protein
MGSVLSVSMNEFKDLPENTASVEIWTSGMFNLLVALAKLEGNSALSDQVSFW